MRYAARDRPNPRAVMSTWSGFTLAPRVVCQRAHRLHRRWSIGEQFI